MKNKRQLALLIGLIAVIVAGIAVAAVAFFSMGREPAPETPATTEATAAQADPQALAVVTTGTQVSYPHTVEQLLAAVDPSGNTVITLQQDISHNRSIELPYSCTVELSGHTIATDPEQGVGLQILCAGTENPTTTLRGGTLRSYSDSLRVKGGTVTMTDMQLYTTFGNAVAFYDTKAYPQLNRIENTTILSASGSCIAFSQKNGNYAASGLTLENSTLISYQQDGAPVLAHGGGETVAAPITLGSHVKLYSYQPTACPEGMVFLGKLAAKEKNVTATVGEQSFPGMTLWATDSQQQVMNILMIGNSFCYSYVDELYGMADAMGYQLNITNLYRGGCSIKSHYTWLRDPAEGKGKCQYFITGALGRYEHPTITTLAEALEYADWDVISCQQHFDGERTVTYEAGYDSCMPYATDMFAYLKENYPDARLCWHETWSYAVGYRYPDNKDEDPTNDRENADVLTTAVQTRQYETIRAVSAAICKEAGVDMIPTGDAWQLARAQLGDTLNKIDYCHDGDGGGGQYLTACVWLEMLLGESCMDNPWRPESYILLENKIPVLQQAAHDAVAAMES